MSHRPVIINKLVHDSTCIIPVSTFVEILESGIEFPYGSDHAGSHDRLRPQAKNDRLVVTSYGTAMPS